MVRQIKFRMAAKTDMGLVRSNNEDNFQAAADLSSGRMGWVNNEVYSLGDKGALLVVADGMGGMNAGEVASELAIKTIRDWFRPEDITPDVLKSRYSIEKFMNSAIVDADRRIKDEAAVHPESRGMGTTIVVAWIYESKLYVSWCGDSRAYIYNPKAGLHQITKDHSYVQTLVDKGTLTRDEAFDFPDSNIITQSLCDALAKAKPESLMKPYDLCDGDIVLLCTDGLSGMLRDHEMEAVIRNNEHDMDGLTDALIHAACEAEGSDNITVALLQVLQGGQECDPSVFEETEKWLGGAGRTPAKNMDGGEIHTRHEHDDIWKYKLIAAVAVAIAIVVIFITMGLPGIKAIIDKKKDPQTAVEQQDVYSRDMSVKDVKREEQADTEEKQSTSPSTEMKTSGVSAGTRDTGDQERDTSDVASAADVLSNALGRDQRDTLNTNENTTSNNLIRHTGDSLVRLVVTAEDNAGETEKVKEEERQ